MENMSQKTWIKIGMLALACQGSALHAQDFPFHKSKGNQVDLSTKGPGDDQPIHHMMHASLRHNEARGIGYKQGYTTLEAFGITDRWNTYFLPFFDLRGHLFNNGNYALNAGAGVRHLFSKIDHVLGVYLYYDWRQEARLNVHQVTPGIELLGERMEYRLNAYLPFGKTQSHFYGLKFDKFKKNNFFIKRSRKHALTGAEAEVGAHLNRSTKYDLFAGAGPYYLSGAGSTWGGKARLQGRYKQYVTLEIMGSYDHFFGAILQGSAAFNFPFGPKQTKQKTSALLSARIVSPPARLEIPMIRKRTRSEVAINPQTGEPWTVWFVNNLSSSLGTYESPFPTLAQAQNASSPYDMIYIFPGDGTSQGLSSGIILKTGQKLFGSGVKQKVGTTKGSATIPARRSTLPTLTSSTSRVVTLTNAYEVSGLLLTSSVADSSLIWANQIANTSIHDNVLIQTGLLHSRGINMLNDLTGMATITNNYIQGITGSGIFISELSNDTLKCTIADNTVIGFGAPITVLFDTGSTVDVDISNNYLTSAGSASCIYIDNFFSGGTLLGSIRNNTCDNSTSGGDLGILLTPAGANGCVTLDGNKIINNQITGSTPYGMFIQTRAGGSFSTVVTRNALEGPGALFVGTAGGVATSLCLRLQNNHSPAGFQITNTAPSTLKVEPLTNNVGTITQVGTTPVPANTCCQ